MFKVLSLIGALLLGATLPGTAQEFPAKHPIKIVVAVPAGGLTDTLARISAEFLQRRLGQAIVVENRPGASSTVGADYVAKSPADGYTLLLAGAEQPVVAAVRSSLPYKINEFTFLIRPFTATPLIVSRPSLPVSTIAELVDYMKAHPGKLRWGTSGVGAIGHVGTAMFEGATGVKGVHVPYTGIGPVYTDLLAANIDFTTGATTPLPEGLKVLGPSGSKRHPLYPDMPTLEELGYKNAAWDLWFGFLAPPNLPQPIADRLIMELDAMYKDPEVIARLETAAKITPETIPLIGEEYKQKVLKELSNWKTIASKEKIVVE
jgi:tripartite-type tricarboxylate transporter receptor subunit TctC